MTDLVDDDCRHVDDCEGCAFLFLSCQVDGCYSPDVTARWVAIGRGRTLRVMLCDRHGALEDSSPTPFRVATTV